ncbi:MAG TPA: DUF805 domain-containing protein [Galbitalea sp.]|jgi:uncharacterized membrane protein YhaH (DUF805 family)
MTFAQSITSVFSKYAEFTGRASRPEFWWFILFTSLVSAALNSFTAFTPYGTVNFGRGLAGVWSVGVLVPTLAVAVRRLRDAGRSWAELFWLLLPVAGLIVLIVHLCNDPVPEPPMVASGAGPAEGVP